MLSKQLPVYVPGEPYLLRGCFIKGGDVKHNIAMIRVCETPTYMSVITNIKSCGIGGGDVNYGIMSSGDQE